MSLEQIVAFFKHAAQGLEEKKQILYLLGPVGSGKSSIAERLKVVMESRPIYALKRSPLNETPLGLFAPERFGAVLEADYGIPRRYLTGIMSPWAVKRLQEYNCDISKFRVVRINPSVLRQVAIIKTEPGDGTAASRAAAHRGGSRGGQAPAPAVGLRRAGGDLGRRRARGRRHRVPGVGATRDRPGAPGCPASA
jgi:predicted Ser/Thr protein kinase